MNTDLDTCNFSELRDAEIVARMRKCNYEKFKTLVRMHLSFELDLNTDEFDLPCHEIVYEDKGKLKKWNRLSKKHKQGVVAAALATGAAGCASVGIGNKNINTANNQCVNGSPTESLNQQIDSGFLFHLQELKDFLMSEKNLQQEGIFRKTGSASRQTELRNQIQNDKPLNLEASGYSAHDCATVFKGYLADLPEPLLTDAHYPAHLQIAPLCVAINCHIDDKLNEDKSTTYSVERMKRELHVLSSIQLLLLLLPDENRQLLQNIIDMLHTVARQHTINKMGPDNLATLFAPHLICPRNLPPEALHYLARNMSSIIAYMIIKGQDIFSVPAKLATDIRAYFLERKRKKTMSPEMALDESMSDISTVNTVYTFVDREKTAAAHNTNTTDTELAQLYAHIQTLPESSKKRRLIKQFNKQNGQGTPLQLQAMNRIKNSEPSRSAKSLSDSIKKHIFHKGIMSRTPKRQPIPAAVLETPNNSSMKPHQQRVLFQSPIPQTFTTLSSSALTTRTTTSFSSTSSTSVLNATSKTSANSHTLYNIKSHPLQKSISSSSLLMSQQCNVNVPTSSNLIVHGDHESSLSSNSTFFNANVAHNHVSSSNSSHSSSDGFVCTIKSISAPVSRQTSTELPNHNNTSIKSSSSSSSSLSAGGVGLDSNSCITPLKLISDAAKHLIVGAPSAAVDKKSVAWDDTHISNIERISHPSTPLRPTSSKNLKSRYKSEPNLSICGTPKLSSTHVQGSCYEMITPIGKHLTGRSLTRKLMKGVSMGNLKFPFSTTESTKRLVRNLRRRSSEDAHIYDKAKGSFAAAIRSGNIPLLQDMDDNDIDDDERDNFEDAHCDSETETEGETETDTETEDIDVSHMTADININTSQVTNSFVGEKVAYKRLLVQQNSLQRRNLDLVTSTPSLILGRRSMSPITKSTQRMPKAMQESIMTPRSRKPVMVLTTTTSCSDQNQTINQNCGVEIEDNNQRNADVDDEDNITAPPQPEIINEDATSLDGFSDIFKRRQLLQANQSFVHHHSLALHNIQSNELKDCTEHDHNITKEQDTLTNHFKEYLLTRSVLTTPPEDTSFTSHSDDFNSSHEIEDVDENQLSSSLLYCLNGNRPEQKNVSNITTTEIYDDDANDNTHTNDNSNAQQNLALFKTTNTRSNISTNSNTSSISNSNSNSSHTPLVTTNRLANNPFVILNNARKRAASQDLEKMSSTLFKSHVESPTSSRHVSYEAGLRSLHTATIKQLNFSNIKQNSMESFTTSSSNKENFEKNENYVVTKKLLISEYSGETSF